MADSYLERVAGEIADLALEDQAASGDITVVDMIAKVMGASSQTLEEAYLTAVRVRRAEARAREILAQRKASNYAPAEKPAPAPMQYEDEDDKDTTGSSDEMVTTNPQTATKSPEEPAAGQESTPSKSKAGMPRRVTR